MDMELLMINSFKLTFIIYNIQNINTNIKFKYIIKYIILLYK